MKNFNLSSSYTRVYSFLRSANVTFNLTAPMKRTVTSFDYDHLLGAITSSTAHYITTIHTHRSIVALSSMSALDTQLRILLAETRRHFVVNQVLHTWWLVIRIDRFQLEAVLVLFPPVFSFCVDAVGYGIYFRILGQSIAVSLVGVPVVACVGRCYV